MTEVLFFSYTGNTRRVAERIVEKLGIKAVEIMPKFKLPYFVWLISSFFPGLKTPVREVKVEGDRVVLCFPKWTFNCPPVTALIKSGALRGRKVFLIVTYGGWRGEQYLDGYAKMLGRYGAKVEGVRLVKRSEIEKVLSDKSFLEELADFVR